MLEFILLLNDIWNSNFGTEILAILVYSIFTFFAIGYLLFFLAGWKKWDRWIIITIYIMFVFFLVGIVISDSLADIPRLNLVLRDHSNNYTKAGTIKCYSYKYGRILWKVPLVDGMAQCKIKYDNSFNITSKEIIMRDKDYTLYKTELDTNNVFIVPKREIIHITFTFKGFNELNENKTISTSWEYTFLTEKEYEEKKSKFLGYLFAIFSLIILSVPTASLAFKKLSESKDVMVLKTNKKELERINKG